MIIYMNYGQDIVEKMKILINKICRPFHTAIPQEFYGAYNITEVDQLCISRKDPRLIKWLEDHPKQQYQTIWIYEIPKGTKYRIITTESSCEDIEYFDDIEWEVAD